MGTKQVRPWGWYEIYSSESGAQTKRIGILPGKRFSLQTHQRRAEKWIVLVGEGLATVGNRQWRVGPGSMVEVPVGEAHRMENTGKEPLTFLEAQFGDYLGEDDIVRLEDDFGRQGAERCLSVHSI